MKILSLAGDLGVPIRYTRSDYIFCCMLKSVQKLFRINLQLNIYPHNTFYDNLGVYSVIIYLTI